MSDVRTPDEMDERDRLRAALERIWHHPEDPELPAHYAAKLRTIAGEALSGEPSVHETTERHPQGGKGHSQTINGAQVKQLLEFIDDDDECEVEVEWLPERTAYTGEKMEAGLYCWLTDYPEEGVMLLDPDPKPSEETRTIKECDPPCPPHLCAALSAQGMCKHQETRERPELTLKHFGHAPGDYSFTCLDCEQEATGDKRCVRCETCATEMRRSLLACNCFPGDGNPDVAAHTPECRYRVIRQNGRDERA